MREHTIRTPRGKIVTNKNGKARLVWNPGFAPSAKKGFITAQKFIDNEVLRLSDPLIPMQSGMLRKSGQLGTVIGSGEVTYIAPYAQYIYYGKLMVGRAPKTLTNRPLSFHVGQAKWFEVMKAAHKTRILTGAAAIMRRSL